MDEVSTMTTPRVIEEKIRVRERRPVSWKTYIGISKVGIVQSNLMTTFAGLFLAAHYNGISLMNHLMLTLFTLIGSALVIAGGCALNNFIDRDIDHLMERTKSRPSVNGMLSEKQVISYGLIVSGLGLILLMFISPVAALIAFVGLFVYVVLYSMWTKRTTTFNTLVGSISGAVPPLIGWAALDPGLDSIAWSLFLIMFIWQPPHFLALAMRRMDEYKRAEIPMLPVIAGLRMTKRQITWYVFVLIPASLTLAHFGILYTSLALLLGIGWLIIGLLSNKYKDEVKWANHMFIYSLNYLTVLFITIVLVHLI